MLPSMQHHHAFSTPPSPPARGGGTGYLSAQQSSSREQNPHGTRGNLSLLQRRPKTPAPPSPPEDPRGPEATRDKGLHRRLALGPEELTSPRREAPPTRHLDWNYSGLGGRWN